MKNLNLNPQTRGQALVDCNNFYVSCERVFDPTLRNKPVAVLSSNDGVIVARSQEVKDLEIPMGAPVFKYRHILERHKVELLSSNFTLYGDMSQRVMQTLREFAPDVEVYSIDESFLDFTNFRTPDIAEYCRKIRAKVYQWTGIPVSIGIASTKTLTKVANHYAKKNSETEGVVDLKTATPQQKRKILEATPVGEVWGIGRAYVKKLVSMGIPTAQKFTEADAQWVRKNFTVAGLRTYLELKGFSAIPMHSNPPDPKTIIRSRSFETPVTKLAEIEQAAAFHTSNAAEQLRQKHLVCRYLTIYLTTNRFKRDAPQYSNSETMVLSEASNETPRLIKLALKGLRRIYKSGYDYKKVGVMLSQFEREGENQLCLDLDGYRSRNSPGLGQKSYDKGPAARPGLAADKINARWGRGTIVSLAEGARKSPSQKPKWRTRHEIASKRYTTCWNELLEV